MIVKNRINYRMFLDDLRDPHNIGLDKTADLFVVRTVQDAIKMIEDKGVPYKIYFDHDLGEDSNGDSPELVKWLIEKDLDGYIDIPKDFSFTVHSGNPVGSKNISSALNNYLEYKFK